ncbi:PAAR domain-containing protein [Cupriavidus basilensis]|uniref:PAAR domain-containing protein n=1 Tax=Cupriavidus basilensis TaxID=68895 RepID=UPI00031F7670|nr:PAAR domain-containing protein [Cupriavidus basilensis]
MSRRIITVGDETDHGGVVLTGSAHHKIGGKGMARLGDKVSCPLFYPDKRPHGINEIVTASGPRMGGIRTALDGDRAACGCKLIGTASVRVGW